MPSRKAVKPTRKSSSTRQQWQAGALSDRPSKTFAGHQIQIEDKAAVIDAIAGQLQASASGRDFNLIRLILLEAEQPGPHTFSFKDYEPALVESHLIMLIEAGLVHGSVMREGTDNTTQVLVNRLTWSGHDLVALLRENARWEAARNATLDAHGRAHFDALVEWLKRPTQP